MKFEELIILLPCHSLEDFPLYHTGDEAEGLLAAWSALFHPAFLASAQTLPTWRRADGPPEKTANRLIVTPQASESLLLTGWPARAKNEGACVVRKKHKRSEIVAAALAELDGGDQGVDADLAADFLALGYVFLQVQLLVRQLRQYTNLDEVHLRNEFVAGAQAACEKQDDVARGHLQTCFDVLLEARERCYPSEVHLVDVTLVADTTLGAGLRRELTGRQPVNLLLSARLVERLAAEQPDKLAQIKSRLEAGSLDVFGGEYDERDLPLQPLESVLESFRAGREVYERHLGRAPTVFGRRRAGLFPGLPAILTKLGFRGATHFTLDDGHFPKASQSKLRWESPDGSVLPALSRAPLDAGKAETFLGLPEKLGESMDLDHVATVSFAHWPGQSSEWYDDLRRMAAYAPVLGKFVTVSEYFAKTDSPGELTRFAADAYRTPYLQQAVIRKRPDPLSSYTRQIRERLQLEAGRTTLLLAATLGKPGVLEASGADWTARAAELARELERTSGPPAATPATSATAEAKPSGDPKPTSEPTPGQEPGSASAEMTPPGASPGVLSSEEIAAASATDARLGDRIARFQADAGTRLAAALSTGRPASAPGVLVFNPFSFGRRIPVELPGWEHAPAVDGAVRASQKVANGAVAVVDVPGLGYAFVPKPTRATSSPKPPQPLAENDRVRNEFFEAVVHPKRGSLFGVYDYEHRKPRIAAQLGLRLPQPRPKPGDVWQDPDQTAVYTEMVADRVEITSSGPALGEIVSGGKLIDLDGKKIATWEQRVQAWLGTRILLIDWTLNPVEPPKADPWNSYFAARFAWDDQAAEMTRAAGQIRVVTDAKRVEAPYYFEARSGPRRTAILTGGLPFHRRLGVGGMLDVFLAVRNETALRRTIGVGVNLEYPMHGALGLLNGPIVVPLDGPPAAGPTGWFFHLDRKNAIATSVAPRGESFDAGFAARILETEGRGGKLTLRCLRAPKAARLVDFAGRSLEDLKTSGDAVEIELKSNEWVQVEVDW